MLPRQPLAFRPSTILEMHLLLPLSAMLNRDLRLLPLRDLRQLRCLRVDPRVVVVRVEVRRDGGPEAHLCLSCPVLLRLDWSFVERRRCAMRDWI